MTVRHRTLTREGARIHVELAGPPAPTSQHQGSGSPPGSGQRLDSGPARHSLRDPARPLLLLHGFTGRATVWRPLLPELAAGREVIAPDLLGHGASRVVDPRAPAAERHRIERQAADLLAVLDRLGVDRADVLGYSMGGRLALYLAVAHPERVSALVLESASPGLEDPRERSARRAQDEARAAFIERAGIRAFVERWEAQPLFASQRRLPPEVWRRQRRQRLACRAEGLAASLRGMGTGVHEPLWSRLPEVEAPTLLLAGALDPKFTALAARMAARLPRARAEVVPEAGHAVHLEQPGIFARHVRAFLDEGRETKDATR
ncbi:2-succinyl-6-hydroxy-2,4-cyclohexadiene-1-carboxylate synthase [Limnochorda pilosa]|uniref:Putative 2-succinyl-6-hydroxy-2,4-cyclohexadiene-1-carboxylate synthase n=1 Tax=Limnochorda pilosa TaxID=1555112 RepID=A0A0K2SMD3_LIMPI|nr:2-succinyl-6-hydroxy-2,4-cyclohexadiene-1-carboxylate synthase [Limnochorda pilosa]BAS28265.1 esterase [Limnochorda pilosa]